MVDTSAVATRGTLGPPEQSGAGTSLHPARATAAAALLAVAAYVVLAAGWVPAPVALTLAALLVCAVPSGRTLSRRIAVNGVAALGLVPATWLLGALGGVNHGALVVSLVLGSLLARVLLSPEPSRAVRELVPHVQPADALLLPGAVLGTVWGWHLLRVRTPLDALEALLPGYDHAAHFDMFDMIWRHGVSVDLLRPAPDGSAWEFAHYPAGFQSFAASLAQLGWGLRPGARESSLVTFAHLNAGVVVVAAVVATACLVSLLTRPRVLPLLAPVTLLLTALLWLPGGQVLWHAFENFWLAAVLAACALLLAARTLRDDGGDLAGLVAGLAAAVGTAMNWLPLVSVCWVAPLIVLVRWWRTHPSGRERAVGLLVSAVAGLVLLRMVLLLVLDHAVVSNLVRAVGAIQGSPRGPILLTALLFVVLTVVVGNGPGRLTDPRLRRLRWCGLGVLTGGLVATGFALVQHSSTGSVAYYAVKLGTGVLLVTACWVAALLAVLLDVVLPDTAPTRPRAWLRVAAVLALCLAGTQVFGQLTEAGRAQARLGCVTVQGRPPAYRPLAREVLAATSYVTPRDQAFTTTHLAIGPAYCYVAALPNDWFHALTGTMSARVGTQDAALLAGVYSARQAEAPARAALEADASLHVLVSPEQVGALTRLLPSELAARVQAWTPPPR